MNKPRILMARAVFPEIIERLQTVAEVEANQEDVLFSKAELVAKLQGKQGVFTTGTDRIDAEVLAACFPGRTIIPIDCLELVWGLGTLHCISQQQPA